MIYLLLFFAAILAAYLLLIIMVMKRTMVWRYKALGYGLITFLMLAGIFLLFGLYDRYWK